MEEETETEASSPEVTGSEISEDDEKQDTADCNDVIFVVGPSGCGKTSLVAKAIENVHHVVLNDRKNEKLLPGKRVTFDELANLRNVAVIVEDLVNVGDQDLRRLRELVNVTSRQKNITPVYLLVHSLVGTNVSCLLPYATGVILAAHPANSKSLDRVLTQYNFEKSGREAARRIFSRGNQAGGRQGGREEIESSQTKAPPRRPAETGNDQGGKDGG